MTELSWPYIAGFFDGEGHVSIVSSHNSFVAIICIGQTRERGKKLLHEMTQWLGRHGILGVTNQQECRYPKAQTLYRMWIRRRTSVIPFLTKVMPYLHIKKIESQDVLRFLVLFPAMNEGKVAKYRAAEVWPTRRALYGITGRKEPVSRERTSATQASLSF